MLILILLPENHEEVLEMIEDNSKLLLKARGYWYYPKSEYAITRNTSKVRITIDKNNVIDFAFFKNIFENIRKANDTSDT